MGKTNEQREAEELERLLAEEQNEDLSQVPVVHGPEDDDHPEWEEDEAAASEQEEVEE